MDYLLPFFEQLKQSYDPNNPEDFEALNQLIQNMTGEGVQAVEQPSGEAEEEDSALVKKRIQELLKQMNPEYMAELIEQGVKAGFIHPGQDPVEAIQQVMVHLAHQADHSESEKQSQQNESQQDGDRSVEDAAEGSRQDKLMHLINEAVQEKRSSQTKKQAEKELEEGTVSKSVIDDTLSNRMSFNNIQQLTTVQINRIIQSLKQGQEQKQRINHTIMQDQLQQEQLQKQMNPKIIPFKVGPVEPKRPEYSLFFREDLDQQQKQDRDADMEESDHRTEIQLQPQKTANFKGDLLSNSGRSGSDVQVQSGGKSAQLQKAQQAAQQQIEEIQNTMKNTTPRQVFDELLLRQTPSVLQISQS